MAFGRLPSNVKIADANGLPTPEFLRAWNYIMQKTGGGTENGPSTPTGLAYSFEAGVIVFSCNDNPIGENVVGYQWRIGADWETAVVVMPLGASTVKFPISLGNIGSNTVWVAAQDSAGNFSTPTSLPVTITAADLGINGPVVNLNAPRAAFVNLKNNGGLTPSTITLTADTFNLPSPTYAWKVDGVLQVGQVSSTFALAAFTGTEKVVRCDVTSGTATAFDIYTIFCVNEGDDSIIAGLTNENQSISVNSSGTAVAGLPANSTMIVVRGGNILSSGVVYSLVSATGCTASINSSTGAISVTAISADTASATFRATVTASGTVIDKVMTLNKSYPGTDGTAGATGPRGSLKGSSTLYGISSSSWSDGIANRIINNMLTGTSLTSTLSTTSHLRVGDTVQLTDGSSFVQSKFWSGSAWLAAATVIEGNVLVNGSGVFTGDISGGANINITGTAKFGGSFTTGSGVVAAVDVNPTNSAPNGLVAHASGSGHSAIFGNGASGAVGVVGLGNSTGAGVSAQNASGGVALEVTGPMTITSTTLVTNLNAEKWNGASSSGTVAGNPGTPTHYIQCSASGVSFKIPIIV